MAARRTGNPPTQSRRLPPFDTREAQVTDLGLTRFRASGHGVISGLAGPSAQAPKISPATLSAVGQTEHEAVIGEARTHERTLLELHPSVVAERGDRRAVEVEALRHFGPVSSSPGKPHANSTWSPTGWLTPLG